MGPDRRRVPAWRSAANERRPRKRPTREPGGDDTARTRAGVRLRDGGDPCGAAPGGWPAPRGWTCGGGSRAASLASGCWVDTCASLVSSSAGPRRGPRGVCELSRRCRRADRARAVSRLARVEENGPSRQSASTGPNSLRSLVPQANSQVAAPWKPVDRVLRCPSHGRSGGRRRELCSRTRGPTLTTVRDRTGTGRTARGPDHPFVVHRVWT